MRAKPVLGLSILAVLSGCGAPAAPTTTAAPRGRSIATGDPLPAAGPAPAACRAADRHRFLASDPHVPLALVGADGVGDARACCAAWATEGEVWTELDGWGAPVAKRTVVGGEGYDVTQCFELALDARPAEPHILVGGPPWTAPPSARWEPSAAERASFLALAGPIDLAFAPAPGDARPSVAKRPLAERIVFFALPGDDRTPGAATHYAVLGGHALVIAGLDPTGVWRVHYFDREWGMAAGPWQAEPYRVLGVFDLDGDGVAEVIVHRRDGPSWDDAVLECDRESTERRWQVVAESAGGSTA